jgi:hypothetical protein
MKFFPVYLAYDIWYIYLRAFSSFARLKIISAILHYLAESNIIAKLSDLLIEYFQT